MIRKGIELKAGQIWSIGERTREKFQNGLSKFFPTIDIGYQVEILKWDRSVISVKDLKSGTNLSVKSQSLGQLITK